MKLTLLSLFLIFIQVAQAQALSAQITTPRSTKTDTSIMILPDTARLVASDTLQKRDSTVKSPPSVKKAIEKVYFDKVITAKGDTLQGSIHFDKSANKFFFKNENLKIDTVLTLDKTNSFTIAATDSTDSDEYLNIINDFYRLETGKNQAITCYALQSYKKQKIKGETVQILQKSYCVIKNGVPYFLNRLNTKMALTTLLAECPLVVDKVKLAKNSEENIPSFIIEYNLCFAKR